MKQYLLSSYCHTEVSTLQCFLQFKSIVPQFYRGAAAVIVVYDITSSDSFKCMKRWVEELTRFEPDAILAVAGNKCDLDDEREVSGFLETLCYNQKI